MASKAQGFLHTPVWYDSTADEVKPIANADGQIPVSLAEAGDALDVHTYGYDGTTWQKLGLIWSYNSRYIDSAENLNLPAGTSTLSLTAITAGYATFVLGICTRMNSATGTLLEIDIVLNSVVIPVLLETAPVAWIPYTYTVPVVLAPGDYIRAQIQTATLNDDLWLYAWGYTMKIG